MFVEFVGRAEVFEFAVVQHCHVVGERQGLRAVVRDHQSGDAAFSLNFPQFFADRRAAPGVERRERLVKEQNARIRRQGAGDGDALLLTAREFVRAALGKRFESHEREHFSHAFPSGLGRPKGRP